MLQKCGNRAHPFTGVWIMYMEMIWWVWKRACLIEIPYVAHYAVSSLPPHATSGSEPRANLRRANCLWGKWENYTFQQESAVVLQDPWTMPSAAGFMWHTPASFSMAWIYMPWNSYTNTPTPRSTSRKITTSKAWAEKFDVSQHFLQQHVT